MFPRRLRFPRSLFTEALKGGRRSSSAHFSAVFPKVGSGYAVVVPKKIARLSVTRHRIKRRVLAVLRALPLPAALLVFPKAQVKDMRYDDIRSELLTLLS